MKKIKLTQGKFALIDDDDFELVNKYKWFYRKSGKTNGKNGYAQHTDCIKSTYYKKTKIYKKHKSIFMHNLIMPPKNGLEIDHINRNGLDNRRSNLRLVTHKQNCANFPKRGQNKYRGATFLSGRSKTAMKWQCSMRINDRNKYIGVYKTQEEAARVYDKIAKQLYGDCAILNFPME